MKHIKKIKLDIDKKSLETVSSVQYDSNTRFLHISLVNNALPVDLTGCSVIISAIKQDDKAIFNNCTIIDEKQGFVEVELTEQFNAAQGNVKCELKIYSETGVLTTKTFDIEVTASITASKAITSSNEFKALTNALKVVQGIDNKADKEKVDEQFNKVNEQLRNIAIDVETLGLKQNKIEDTQIIQDLINKHDDLVLYFPSGIYKIGCLNLGTDKNITFRGKSSAFATSVNKSVSNPRIIDTYSRIIVNEENDYWLEHDNCTIIFDKISVINGEVDKNNEISSLKKMTMIKTNENVKKGKVFATESSFIGWKNAGGDRNILTKNESLLHSCWLASRCRFTENEVALSQLVDSRIVDCSFNKNDWGIILKSNAGFSTIMNNRLEWNKKNGIFVSGGHEINIVDNEFDRNLLSGCYIQKSVNGSLMHNTFRRNGALDTLEKDDYENNVHYVVKDCDNFKIKDNTTRAMQTLDTPTGGITRPSNVCQVIDNNHLIFKDNDLLGCTRTNKIEGAKIENNINSIIDNLADLASTNKVKLPEIHFMNGSADEDATLIKCSNGVTVLIDCGEENTGNWLCDRLNKLGVTRLDCLFITHSHSDHIGGAVAVLERFRPKFLYYKDITWQLPSIETEWRTLEYHNKMINKAKELGVKLVKLTQFTTLDITEKEQFVFYNCGEYHDKTEYNMNSLMIGYNYFGTKVLFQGDCYSSVAYDKYKGQIDHVNLLKMVHHGGRDKLSESWLSHLRPNYTFYSHYDSDNLEYYKALTLTKLYTRDYVSHISGCFLVTASGVIPTSTVKETRLENRIIKFNDKKCYINAAGELIENGIIEHGGNLYLVKDWYIATPKSYGDWIYMDNDVSYCLYEDGTFVRNEWVKSKIHNAWYYCGSNGRPFRNTTAIIGTEKVTFGDDYKADRNFD